jgi:hypothetical protein
MAVPQFVGIAQQPPPDKNASMAWLVFAMSSVVVVFSAYLNATRVKGVSSLEHFAFFIGACVGPYAVSAAIVLLYYLISRRKAQNSTKLIAAFLGASCFAFLAILAPARTHSPAAQLAVHPDWGRHLADLAKDPKTASLRTATVWDPAFIALLADLKSFNADYLAAVGQLDLTAQPLYTPESFRDAATMQQRIVQLRDRLAVAEKFSSLDPIVAKMPGYVAAVNASDHDKRQFLVGFSSGVQQGLAIRNTAGGYEREWLSYSIALYEFMLANQTAYAVAPDGKTCTFHSPAVAAEFDRRLKKIAQLKQQFLQANREYLRAQNAVREQLGLPE